MRLGAELERVLRRRAEELDASVGGVADTRGGRAIQDPRRDRASSRPIEDPRRDRAHIEDPRRDRVREGAVWRDGQEGGDRPLCSDAVPQSDRRSIEAFGGGGGGVRNAGHAGGGRPEEWGRGGRSIEDSHRGST